MGIKPKFTVADINRAMQELQNDIDAAVMDILMKCGEKFVTDAKDQINISSSLFPKGAYKTQTGNLKHSIGYFILRNMVVVYDSSNGKGSKKIISEVMRLSLGIGWIIVGYAGMNYASYVESKGYNVISSQKETFIINLDKGLKNLSRKLKSRGITRNWSVKSRGRITRSWSVK
jgi:hypothetical protein